MKYIFDVDGTLTPSRKKIDPDFLIFFNSFALANEVYLVTGSDRDKTIEQITHLLYCNCKRVYNCAGNDVYEGDISVYRNDWTLPLEAREHLLEELHESHFPVRTGTHIEERPGCVNFSIVGRGANQTERLVYSDWDCIKKEREGIAERFNKKFPDLHAFVGGVTGVDISSKGCDKSQIIRDFSDGDVVFFGDRLDPHGNDRPLADAIEKNKLGMVVEVLDWKDTWNKLKMNEVQFIKHRIFRETDAVVFYDISVEESNAADLVIHDGPATSPPDDCVGAKSFYIHSFQDDYNRVVSGSRTFELVNLQWKYPYHLVNLTRQSGALLIPRGTFHRSKSGEEGSIVINQAKRYDGFDASAEFYPVSASENRDLYNVLRNEKPVIHSVKI